ncbi:MAG TPA: multiheme c-type cytochrome [Candidatus Udaeobacter sp.]|nr:multiheme c-type cytochrome [Candidatus Udaeobacter sp.]
MPEIVPKLSRSWWQGLLVIAAVAAASVLTLISLRDFQREGVPPQNRPIQSQIAGYVSSNACRACHPGNYASWHASFHRTMTQVATPQSLPPDTDKLELAFNGREYKAERRGEKFFVRMRPEGGSYGEPQQVVLVTGSHNLQILWLETGEGRTLQQFPFGYIVAEKMWAPVSETFLLPPNAKEYYSTGAWNGACMDCHVTQGQSRFVAGNKWDSQVAEFGIACEACHSEGREHIERNRNPFRRFKIHLTTKSDPTVTNPASLKGPESGLACGQCHSVWAFNDMTDKIDFNRHGAAFRPGAGDLSQRFVVQPNAPDHSEQKDFIRRTEPDFFHNRFWGDGMIRVTGREFNGVQASPCFRGGEFSCISCHEMHLDSPGQTDARTWARTAQLKPKMDSDAACLQCHKDMTARLVAHTHHPAESSGSRCYNCHMPRTTFGLLHAVRSHQVSSPNVQESIAYGRPNACNLCHLDQTLGWAAQHLHAWYNQPVPELSEDDRAIAAGVQWILKGDAGQRALVAWGMGWESAQKIAGRNWLYPYLIYTLTDSYAAVRFDAWKSLQTLPGFSDFSFIYTAPDQALGEAATRAYEKWLREVRNVNAVYRRETAIDSDGRIRQDVFQRLRSARDEKPIFLAE